MSLKRRVEQLENTLRVLPSSAAVKPSSLADEAWRLFFASRRRLMEALGVRFQGDLERIAKGEDWTPDMEAAWDELHECAGACGASFLRACAALIWLGELKVESGAELAAGCEARADELDASGAPDFSAFWLDRGMYCRNARGEIVSEAFSTWTWREWLEAVTRLTAQWGKPFGAGLLPCPETKQAAIRLLALGKGKSA
jgi:hypothetical protein